MDKEFDIQEYMTKGVETVVRDAMRAIHCTQGRRYPCG